MRLCIYTFLLVIPFIYAQEYSVLNYGAIGDGKTDDTQAVRATLAAAKASNGGRVIFDHGYTFLTGAFNLSSNVILDVRGTILGSINVSNYEIIPILPWYGNDSHDNNNYINGMTKQPLVYSNNVTNITLTGGGIIDGNGPYWYACMFKPTQPPCYPYGRQVENLLQLKELLEVNETTPLCLQGYETHEIALIQEPRLFQPTYTSNILVENITLKDSAFWTLHLAWTTNVYIRNTSIIDTEANIILIDGWHNTDGIDIDCSVNVTVENCYISVSDDGIVVKAGWNSFGRNFGRTSENILVRNINVKYTNGLAIGSEMSGGAKNVTFRDSTISDAWHALLLKTELGRGGTIEDVTYYNISIYNTQVAIELNMYYGQPGDDDTTIPTIKNVVLDTINGNSVDYIYNLVGMPVNPISNIYFTNINITNIRKSVYHTCSNITGTCDSTSVFPICPSCLQTEACFDASNDCSTYMNFCNNALYHATLCDLCRKSCNLCSKC